MYYVYVYKDPITSIIKYVGKGKGDRLNHHWKIRTFHYNEMFKNYLISLDQEGLLPTIEIVKDSLTNADAYIYEFRLIRKYGRVGLDKNGVLLNRSAGFEHFNINIDELDDTSLIDYLNSTHFNFKELPKEEELKIVELYTNFTFGIIQLCKNFGHGPNKIKSILRKYDISPRDRGGQPGDLNGMYGKVRTNNAYFSGHSHTVESRQNISLNSVRRQPITINGIPVYSIADAAQKLKTTTTKIRYSLKIGKPIVIDNVQYVIKRI